MYICCRPVVSTSQEPNIHVVGFQPMPVVPMPELPPYEAIPGAMCGDNTAFDIAGYEHLKDWGNIYNSISLDEPPAPPATGKPEAPAWKPPVKPKPKRKPTASTDSAGYLKF